MSAFSYSASSQIKENIRALFYRVKELSKLPLSHEEFSSLFIPAEHRQMYRDMSMLARLGDHHSVTFRWGTSKLYFHLLKRDGQCPLPAPQNMVVQHDAPTELVERITTFVNNGGDASGEYGRVHMLFNALNDKMTKGQIRFVWPSVLTLLAVNPILAETLKELQDVKVPAKQPELLPGLLAACRKAAATIATASLIPSDVEPFDMGAGFVEVANGQQYNELGLGEYNGLT